MKQAPHNNYSSSSNDQFEIFSNKKRRKSIVVGDDFHKIFREFYKINSCFTTAGFFKREIYRFTPASNIGFYGTFENGRLYKNWLWKDLIPTVNERAVAFFRQDRFDLSGLIRGRAPRNMTTLVFTDQKCHMHLEKDGSTVSFSYDHVRQAEQNSQRNLIAITLINGKKVLIPIVNGANLCSYFLALRDNTKDTQWQKDQIIEENKYHTFMLTAFLTSVGSLGAIIYIFRDKNPSGGQILYIAMKIAIPAFLVSWALVRIYKMLKRKIKPSSAEDGRKRHLS